MLSFTSRRFSLKLIKIKNSRQLHKPDVRIVEVGPRDGLQNQPVQVPTEVKIELINKLSNSGLQSIEVTSFVSPKWVPQMADNSEVFSKIVKNPTVSYPVTVPNIKGLHNAISVGVEEIAVMGSASEGFARKNANNSIEGCIKKIEEIVKELHILNKTVKIRGYISCVIACPYDGYIKPKVVTSVCQSLLNLGCYEIALGDTIGVGTKSRFESLLKDLLTITSADKIAIHSHDTYGQSLVNICTALEHGVRVFDSSVSGLGGCPYAPGATGNVATEDLIYMLHGMGMETGIDLKKIIEVGHFISSKLNTPTASRVNQALYSKYF